MSHFPAAASGGVSAGVEREGIPSASAGPQAGESVGFRFTPVFLLPLIPSQKVAQERGPWAHSPVLRSLAGCPPRKAQGCGPSGCHSPGATGLHPPSSTQRGLLSDV